MRVHRLIATLERDGRPIRISGDCSSSAAEITEYFARSSLVCAEAEITAQGFSIVVLPRAER